MKWLKLSAFLLFLASLAASCQKEINGDDENGGDGGSSTPGKLVRIHQGLDPLTDDDTVYLISYNAAGRISKVIDSMYEDTMTAHYDASGRIDHISSNLGENVYYTYDANGLLVQQDYNWGTDERFVFTYDNGVIAKKSYYDNATGPMALWRYWTYTLTNGNITNIKEYNKNGTLVGEANLTYSTLPNDYKDLALFNYGNYLGLDPFVNYESLFNKNLVSTIELNGINISLTSTLNDRQQLGKLVAHETTYDQTLTWRFNYK